MLVGYPVNQMSNQEAYDIIHSRDIIWLSKLYKYWISREETVSEDLDNEEDALQVWMSNQGPQRTQQNMNSDEI